MKSLLKISRRYILTAVFITVFVVFVNLAAFLYLAYASMTDEERQEGGLSIRQNMESISSLISGQGEDYVLSQEGYDILKETSFQWAMLLDREGKAVWEYELPRDIPRQFTITDVASFSRWYLEDYPVYVWQHKDGLLVFGCGKDSIVRISTILDGTLMKNAGWNAGLFGVLNLMLLLSLAMGFGYRFYKSLKPVAGGIEALSKKEKVEIPEKGMIDELAAKLNQASEILCQQNRKLEQRDNARTDWIAGVSHDIRTPLALIVGYADELEKDKDLSDAQREKAAVIQRQSLVIRQLISDLNLTSKLEYQAQPLSMIEYSPAELLRECAADYYNQGLDDRYEIELQIGQEEERIRLTGDRGLLLRAFRNLVGNSIRHNPEGCTVYLKMTEEEGNVRILFSDSGPGIPAAVLKVLKHTNTQENSHVHVMGLRIVKQIAEAHGGRVEFVKKEREMGLRWRSICRVIPLKERRPGLYKAGSLFCINVCSLYHWTLAMTRLYPFYIVPADYIRLFPHKCLSGHKRVHSILCVLFVRG